MGVFQEFPKEFILHAMLIEYTVHRLRLLDCVVPKKVFIFIYLLFLRGAKPRLVKLHLACIRKSPGTVHVVFNFTLTTVLRGGLMTSFAH